MTTPTSDLPTIESLLASVSQRIRLRNVGHWASVGLAAGCFVALIVACISVAVAPVSWMVLPVVMLAFASAGALVGALVPVPSSVTARLVDQHYQLKDRTISGLQFQCDADPVRLLQADDARRHLSQINPQACVPITANRPALYSAASMLVIATALLGLARPPLDSGIDAMPVALAVDQADDLRETMLDELEQLKENIDQPELDELTEKLDDLIEELEKESMDERDMLATLSQMEQAIQSAREAMQLEMTDAQMQALAAAIEPSEAMKAAAAAMKEGDYDKASEKLEKIDPADLSDKERRAVADNLKKFLSKLPAGKQGKLSGAAEQMQAGLESKNLSECKDGMCKLAGLCKSQSQCKKIGECMACQLNKLSQCKSQCRGGKNGGNNASKSNSPKNSWGRGATGKANDGEATRLDATRNQEQLTGQQGDGPSESEVIAAPEGEQDAARLYANQYQKFRNQAEAVLDSEPLPLGHRETVRQYFENIRPSTLPAAEPR
ncbi:hypothetical protein Pla100_21770 [Neorhodopirellula pilleata]|uniref:Uncharacterized protein n=2 Tax=Neorhodopirellula pilleata TaxID=2714738 RepID=A0A5C6AHB2_9BACT|nr:hypothetical protein Pla100_21770 [Neorhodopirellula pilleata]